MTSEPWAVNGAAPESEPSSGSIDERQGASDPGDDHWSGGGDRGPAALIGRSPAMIELLRRIERVVDSPQPALVLGPTGAGKDLVALTMHRAGPRAAEPFVAVHCGALAGQLGEVELFGHERGAFEGADRPRRGALAEVRGGTLYLDDLAGMPLAAQGRLLGVLDTGRFRPFGGREEQFRGRVVASGPDDLGEEVRRGRLREDLYFRVRVLPIAVPALADRRVDVPLLARHFLGAHDGSYLVTAAALATLAAYDWPGNVRQLRNVIDRLALFADDRRIDERAVARELRWETAGGETGARTDPLGDLARRVLATCGPNKLLAAERALIDEALRAAEGDRGEAARRLGVNVTVVSRGMLRPAAPPPADAGPAKDG